MGDSRGIHGPGTTELTCLLQESLRDGAVPPQQTLYAQKSLDHNLITLSLKWARPAEVSKCMRAATLRFAVRSPACATGARNRLLAVKV